MPQRPGEELILDGGTPFDVADETDGPVLDGGAP